MNEPVVHILVTGICICNGQLGVAGADKWVRQEDGALATCPGCREIYDAVNVREKIEASLDRSEREKSIPLETARAEFRAKARLREEMVRKGVAIQTKTSVTDHLIDDEVDPRAGKPWPPEEDCPSCDKHVHGPHRFSCPRLGAERVALNVTLKKP